jgi:hypothetical protein
MDEKTWDVALWFSAANYSTYYFSYQGGTHLKNVLPSSVS